MSASASASLPQTPLAIVASLLDPFAARDSLVGLHDLARDLLLAAHHTDDPEGFVDAVIRHAFAARIEPLVHAVGLVCGYWIPANVLVREMAEIVMRDTDPTGAVDHHACGRRARAEGMPRHFERVSANPAEWACGWDERDAEIRQGSIAPEPARVSACPDISTLKVWKARA